MDGVTVSVLGALVALAIAIILILKVDCKIKLDT